MDRCHNLIRDELGRLPAKTFGQGATRRDETPIHCCPCNTAAKSKAKYKWLRAVREVPPDVSAAASSSNQFTVTADHRWHVVSRSHEFYNSGGLLWCRRCGRWCSSKITQHLRNQCPGAPQGPKGPLYIRNLREGKRPLASKFDKWPDQSIGTAIKQPLKVIFAD